MERGTKKKFSSELFDSIFAEFKENIQFKEKKSKKLKVKKKETKLLVEVSSAYLKNLVIWNQKYNDNPFLNLTFCSRFCMSLYCICLLFF